MAKRKNKQSTNAAPVNTPAENGSQNANTDNTNPQNGATEKKADFKFTFKFKVTDKEGEKEVTRSANADTEKEAFQDVWSKLVKEFDKHFIEYTQDFKKEKLD